MEDQLTHSPILNKTQTKPTSSQLTFSEAMQVIVDGKKVTKDEWKSKKIYGLLKDGFLMLHKEDDKFYQWIISDGDMMGVDWRVLEETN